MNFYWSEKNIFVFDYFYWTDTFFTSHSIRVGAVHIALGSVPFT